MKLAASFLSSQEPLNETIEKLANTTIDYLHLDIMDGLFVPRKTWGIEDLEPIVSTLKTPLDVHLMVDDVKAYVDEFARLKPEYMTFHLEAVQDPNEMIAYIKSLGIKPGLAINPEMDVSSLEPYLPVIDLVILMTVKPGKGGQPIEADAANRLEQLATYKQQYPHILIEVDGGIKDYNIKDYHLADIILVGSFITDETDYQGQIDKLGLS